VLFKPYSSGATMTRGGMYNWRVQAVQNALEERGLGEGPLEISDLTALGHLDQYHYLGTEACDHVIELLGLGKGSNVLDIGSGIGGPARYIAANSGCTVTGVELQAELAEAGKALTARVIGLQDRVNFVTGDIAGTDLLSLGLSPASFDHAISLLVNLHIPDRAALLQRTYEAIKPGGTFVFEDFVQLQPFTPSERTTLSDLVKAPSVTPVEEYLADLRHAGFVDVEATDLTPQWTRWTRLRHKLYRASAEQTIALHGSPLYEQRVHFYEAIDRLFDGGNLGGVQISGRRPSKNEAALHRGRQSLQALSLQVPAGVQVIEGVRTPTNGVNGHVPARRMA